MDFWLLGLLGLALCGVFTWLGEWSKWLAENIEYEEEDDV